MRSISQIKISKPLWIFDLSLNFDYTHNTFRFSLIGLVLYSFVKLIILISMIDLGMSNSLSGQLHAPSSVMLITTTKL